MNYNELMTHVKIIEEMAKTALNGKNFKEISNWVLYVYETHDKTFNAKGFTPNSPELKALQNDWKHTIYSNVRKMLATEKEEYSKRLDSYTPQRPRGETYGYTLKDPYTLEEIQKYEMAIHERLPEELRDYLLLVSRELKTYSYPMEFELDTDIGTCKIPISTTYLK